LIGTYGKNEEDELTAAQKKSLKQLAEEYQLAALRAARESRKGSS
jgi:hypothetical protein